MRLAVRTAPAGAELSLDGGPIPNPFVGSFARDRVLHRLEARAPGRHRELRWVAFDRDSEWTIALKPEPRAHPPSLPAPPSPPIAPAATPPPSVNDPGGLITEFPEKR